MFLERLVQKLRIYVSPDRCRLAKQERYCSFSLAFSPSILYRFKQYSSDWFELRSALLQLEVLDL